MRNWKKFDYKKNLNYIVLGLLGVFLIIVLAITAIFLNDNSNNLDTNTKAAVGPNYLLSFDKTSILPNLNDEFPVAINVTAGTAVNIQGYKIVINFDKTRLQVTNIDYTVGTPSLGLASDNTSLATVNSNGKVVLFAEDQSPSGYPLSQSILTNLDNIKFKYIGSGAAQVSFNDSQSNFIQIESDGSLTSKYAVVQGALIVGQLTPTTTSVFVPTSNSPIPTTSIQNNTVTKTPVPTTKVTSTNTQNSTTTPLIGNNSTSTPIPTSFDSTETVTSTSITNPTNAVLPTTISTTKNTQIALSVEILIWVMLGGILITVLATGTIILIQRGKKIPVQPPFQP